MFLPRGVSPTGSLTRTPQDGMVSSRNLTLETGTYDQIKQLCKAYRVYFSTPPDIEPGQDYLVDHSIYFYLMGT